MVLVADIFLRCWLRFFSLWQDKGRDSSDFVLRMIIFLEHTGDYAVLIGNWWSCKPV